MGQIRYQNFGRPLVSFDENRRTIGLAIPGVYCGWDRITNISGNDITISHDITGVKATRQDNSTQDGPLGLTISRHGVEVYEDAPVIVNVSNNAGNAFIRIDWLVMNHNYLGTGGGTPASYSVIQGPNGVNFAEPSALSNPATQVLIGKIYIPASAPDLSAISYIKQPTPKLGGYGISLWDSVSIQNWNDGKAVTNDLNLVKKTGIFGMYAATLNIPVAGRNFAVICIASGVTVNQIATDQSNGKVYSRNTFNGIAWSPWQNLNNSDVVVDFGPINTKIGSQTYTAQNFVTNGQSLTASIDALDIEAEVQLNALSTTNTNVSNLTSAIGDRQYTNNYLLTDGESITASLDKLDTLYPNIIPSNWVNLNPYLTAPWVQYSKQPNYRIKGKQVILEGLVWTSISSITSAIATFPAPIRPTKNQYLYYSTSEATGENGGLFLDTSGNLSLGNTSGGSPSIISLDGMSYWLD